MLDWMKRRASAVHPPATALPERSKGSGRAISGEYLPLYTYLENRYASTVVLTFSEIEELLGITLPDEARTSRAWWANDDTRSARPAHADSWILSGRTARPNLLAQTVAFERPS